jgi:hypothetical protein
MVLVIFVDLDAISVFVKVAQAGASARLLAFLGLGLPIHAKYVRSRCLRTSSILTRARPSLMLPIYSAMSSRRSAFCCPSSSRCSPYPTSPGNVVPVGELVGQKIYQAIIGSSTNRDGGVSLSPL